MTKKHYILISKVFNVYVKELLKAKIKEPENKFYDASLLTLKELAEGLTLVLQQDNHLFDKEKFLLACGVVDNC